MRRRPVLSRRGGHGQGRRNRRQSRITTRASPVAKQEQPTGSLRAWFKAIGAGVAVGLVTVLAVFIVYRVSGLSDPAPAPSQPPQQATQAPVEPFNGNNLKLNRDADRLAQGLPQLFPGTAVANQPVSALLTTKSAEFCQGCDTDKGFARFRVVVEIEKVQSGGIKLVEGDSTPAVKGPYLVVVTPAGEKVTPSRLVNNRQVQDYEIAKQYASREYGQVVLIPSNWSSQGEAGAPVGTPGYATNGRGPASSFSTCRGTTRS